jgi:hypothetical protein
LRVIEADYPLGDGIVLSFEHISSSTSLPDRIRVDLDRIFSAFSCVCEEKYDGALFLIKPITLSPLFSPWKWFVKGICSFYRCEDKKASKALEKVPVGTAPANAARPSNSEI